MIHLSVGWGLVDSMVLFAVNQQPGIGVPWAWWDGLVLGGGVDVQALQDVVWGGLVLGGVVVWDCS